MNGAESLVRSLLANGVDTCFANPGTSEMHFVAALDRVPGVRCILGLQENVVTGMADGYYRIRRAPAATLLHCGPGLSNGLANLHNARRAESGIVNIVGDHATAHRPYDSPLTADVPALAGTVSAFVCTPRSATTLASDAGRASAAAKQHPGQIATLILPADISWSDGGVEVAPGVPDPAPVIDPHAVDTARKLLAGSGRKLILLGNSTATKEAAALAFAIADHTGAEVMGSSLIAAHPAGRGTRPFPRVPYYVDHAIEVLAKYDTVLLVNCPPPVGFFGYPGKPSELCRPDALLHTLTRSDQDGTAALMLLAEMLGLDQGSVGAVPTPKLSPVELPQGELSPEKLDLALAALLPAHAIIVDESLTYSNGYPVTKASAEPHDWLIITGGAIGGGMPVSTGAAVAGEGRRVVNLQADGSAAYTLQSLWTQARENLPCTTVLLNNGRYNILLGEYKNVGAVPGPTAMSMLDLGNPTIRWAEMARSMGVEAVTATSMEEYTKALAHSFASAGPYFIELLV
ncbi:acetolactate synthase large subunit [Rhizobium sp. TH2]|uniref:acetolactate synthase large subunit n=1 Tax=Rhizobium sp. TH2 TaxID=2775403 RepID=UPI002157A021|nr:acetolactate synthase large subunit [Rhizobium sp. TH2]UVC10536.1 acetolactate synthase large subunit [Rhizobium sp. TH2]